jgi:hypothetical protein
MKNKLILALMLICTLNSGIVIRGQLILSGTHYFQDFNSLTNGLPAGWTVRTNATSTSLGTSVVFPTIAKTWGDTTGEFGNCASTIGNKGTNFLGTESAAIQAACTNRALGIRQTAAFGDPGAAFVLEISNTVGLMNLGFSIDLEMLRMNAYSTTWKLEYAVGNPPSVFNTLGMYLDPGVFGATNQTFNLGADASNQPSSVWIRIAALNAAAGTGGSRDTFAIDNFLLSWSLRSASPPVIIGLTTLDGNAYINFSGDPGDSTDSFLLETTASLSDGFTNAAATVMQTAPGRFQAVCACAGVQQFYRVKRR